MKNTKNTIILLCSWLLLQGIFSTNTLAQSGLNNERQLAAIDSAYNTGELERVIRLATEFLKSNSAASNLIKISIYEKMAYTQLDLDKRNDAEKSILELLKFDADFTPNPEFIPPAKVQFVESIKATHTAKLVIITEPPNLNISINNGYREAKSPCFFPLVKDTYLIFIESPDTAIYKNWKSSVILQGGKDSEQNIVLEAADAKQDSLIVKSKRAWYKSRYVLGAGGLVFVGAAIVATRPSTSTTPTEQKLPMHPARPNK